MHKINGLKSKLSLFYIQYSIGNIGPLFIMMQQGDQCCSKCVGSVVTLLSLSVGHNRTTIFNSVYIYIILFY